MSLTNQCNIRLILLIFPVSDHFVVPQGWSLTREFTVISENTPLKGPKYTLGVAEFILTLEK